MHKQWASMSLVTRFPSSVRVHQAVVTEGTRRGRQCQQRRSEGEGAAWGHA